RHFSRLVY
ncbi:antitoxin HigA, partial [Escherichia coli 96.0428]